MYSGRLLERTGYGDVYLHVSEIEHFVEYDPVDVGPEPLSMSSRKWTRLSVTKCVTSSPELLLESAVLFGLASAISPSPPCTSSSVSKTPGEYKKIASYLAGIVEDGDCIQLGVGDPSSKMVQLGVFDGKQDLGMHTELIAPAPLLSLNADHCRCPQKSVPWQSCRGSLERR